MKTADFYNILYSPTSIDKSAMHNLIKIEEEYPYFQLASMLSLKSLKENNNTLYKTQLAKVATKVLNREALFNYIYPEYNKTYSTTKDIEKPQEKGVKTISTKETTSKPIAAKEISTPKPIKTIKGDSINSKSELMAQVKSRLGEIEKENNKSKKSEDKNSKINLTQKTEENITKQISKSSHKKEIRPMDRGSALNLIESFIKTNPSINRPDNKEYTDEIAMGEKSLEESYELVSETMAKLFIKQGYIKKAIKVYEKLSLIYPEKSTYFADRILELKN